MPAVSVCDPVAAALRHSLELGQGKVATESSISVTLAGSASRILQTDIRYEESDGYNSRVLDHLKAKYIVLGLPNGVEQNDGIKNSSAKKNSTREMGPSLPEPETTLYQADKIVLGWKGTFPVGAGMYNVGNTCYLNSTLQALFHVPALVNWLLSDSHHTSKCEQNDGGGECLTCAVAKTLQFSHEKSGSAIKPFYIYNKLKLICRTMVPGQQEDAHEFLRYLLEGMERAYLARHRATKLESYSKETTPVNQIFGGYLRTEVKCLQCRHVSTTFQHFQDLLVDIRKASTLDDALSSYFSREQLDNNDYKCEACKRRVPATKQFSLERAPKVLCVQLKRFSVLGGKISRHIGFKQIVDMGPHLWREPGEPVRQLNYKLTSMVTHMGPSVNCGHYTAVAQVSTGQYYSFDDSCVRPVNVGNVLNTNAYIMIFEMDPSSQQNQHSVAHSVKVNGTGIAKNLQNGVSMKLPGKPSTSAIPAYCSEPTNGIAKKIPSDIENTVTVTSKSSGGIAGNSNKSTNFIGPQLPARMIEKSQPRLVMHIKNGKVLSGSSLVPYEGSSDEEEIATTKIPGSGCSSGGKSGAEKPSNGKIFGPKETGSSSRNTGKDSLQKIGKNNGSSGSSNETRNSKTQIVSNSTSSKINGASSGNGVNGPAKHHNGKSESNGRLAESNGKEKWHPNRVKTGTALEEKILTKAAASSINGWQVSKDAPSPTSGATANGWSVTENKEGKSSNQNASSQAPSAAAPRNFNGTNRSETVSHLLKLSNRGYGTSSVSNWNGGRAHLERDVDNERREERKRHHDPDDEEMDRGRSKKSKNHRDYECGRSNPGYNPFQEYQNGKSWNRPNPNHNRQRLYYNTSNHRGNRHRHNGGNNRNHGGQQNFRFHNHSRDSHWQRR